MASIRPYAFLTSINSFKVHEVDDRAVLQTKQ
jgi:hypothetical protein